MTQFQIDLKEGEHIENLFAKVLFDRGNKVVKAYGYHKEWDLAIVRDNKIAGTYEVKYDREAERTGNIAIEVYFKGQKSGLLATEADYMVFYLKGRFYIIDRLNLLEYLRANNKHLKKAKAGDNGDAIVVLLPYKYLDGLNFVERCDML